jgi:hypothetical protein
MLRDAAIMTTESRDDTELTTPAKTSHGAKLKRLALMGLLTVAFTSVVCECGLRVAGVGYPEFHEPDPALGWRLIPNTNGIQHQEGFAHVQINSDGMRDREHDVKKPAGTMRIAFIGDSYTEAMQVEVDRTYLAEVERNLGSCSKLAGKKVEVLNFGVSAYGTSNAYLSLDEKVWKYAPDVVVLGFYTGNDVKDNAKALDIMQYRPYFELKDGKLVLDASAAQVKLPLTSRIWHGILRYSNLVQLLQKLRNDRVVRAEVKAEGVADLEKGDAVYAEPKSETWKRAWDVTDALVMEIDTSTKRHGARFMLAVLSSAVQVEPNPAAREALQKRLGSADLFYPDSRLMALAAAKGFRGVAIAPELQKQAQVSKVCFHGFTSPACSSGHYNEAGNKAAGELIAKSLCEGF